MIIQLYSPKPIEEINPQDFLWPGEKRMGKTYAQVWHEKQVKIKEERERKEAEAAAAKQAKADAKKAEAEARKAAGEKEKWFFNIF